MISRNLEYQIKCMHNSIFKKNTIKHLYSICTDVNNFTQRLSSSVHISGTKVR